MNARAPLALIDAAIAVAQQFGSVVPLNCANRYVPRVAYADALIGEREIAEHFYAHPGDGIGVVARGAGLVVIDVEHPDKREGCPDGRATLERLVADVGALAPTRTHRTKHGGAHLVYRIAPTIAIRSAQGELRGAGLPAPGLDVVAGHALLRWPPTPGYEILVDLPIADLPAAWAAALSDQPERRASVTPIFAKRDRARRYACTALERETVALGGLGAGRNCALSRAAFCLGQLVPAITTHEIEQCLLIACESNGALKEHGRRACIATIQRGLRAGAKSPRTVAR